MVIRSVSASVRFEDFLDHIRSRIQSRVRSRLYSGQRQANSGEMRGTIIENLSGQKLSVVGNNATNKLMFMLYESPICAYFIISIYIIYDATQIQH